VGLTISRVKVIEALAVAAPAREMHWHDIRETRRKRATDVLMTGPAPFYILKKVSIPHKHSSILPFHGFPREMRGICAGGQPVAIFFY
jgi:hypothetical protein